MSAHFCPNATREADGRVLSSPRYKALFTAQGTPSGGGLDEEA
ncbi:MAG: hypothetical protein AAFY81_05385 [Pseudomonadota bacterium]